MTEAEINRLAGKYRNGTITPAEKQVFLQWYNSFNQVNMDLPMNVEGSEEETEARMLERISRETYTRAPQKKIYRLAWIKYAAVILLLMGVGSYYFIIDRSTGLPVTSTPAMNADVMPGSNKAVLTLSDGSVITLNNNNSNTIHDGDIVIANNKNKLVYSGNEKMVLNTMATPHGGQYQLTLADGTRIWLNAASSITYPTAFSGKTREVEIKGEAYIEVSQKKNQPFIIHTPRQIIEVLGTSFNVNAYENEQESKTTLVEGAVKVSVSDAQLILRAGQQAVMNNKLLLNDKPDIGQALSWKNGTFNFHRQDFASCMRQLERWYDVKVVYDKGVPDAVFGGKIGRELTLMQVLRGMEGVVAKFRLEGRVLHVLPK